MTGEQAAHTSEESHHVEGYTSRHFNDTVEIWCPEVDETKVVLGWKYVRHCPMCGDDVTAPRRVAE